MQHRYEDLSLITEVVVEHRPTTVVELGTAGGGFTAFLAETVAPWGGVVFTFDTVDQGASVAVPRALGEGKVAHPSISFCLQDVQHGDGYAHVRSLIAQPGSMLYCDNGHKEHELEIFAPHMGPRALLGCHDYQDEVRPEWAEPFLARQGYQQHRHPEFEALAHPVDYPVSMTRFWVRS